MKRTDLSLKMQIFLWSLIPCGFTFINVTSSFFVSFLPVSLVTFWFLAMIWIVIGYKCSQLLHHYGKALILLNWMGLVCLIFAFVYYTNVSVRVGDLYWLDGIWLPIHISNYMIGDIFAGLYSSPFLIGGMANWGWYNFEVDMCIVNTLAGLFLFTFGYLIDVVLDFLLRITNHMNCKQKLRS